MQLSKLIAELAAGGSKELGITLAPGTVERLLAYGRSVAHFPTAVKEVGGLVMVSFRGYILGWGVERKGRAGHRGPGMAAADVGCQAF